MTPITHSIDEVFKNRSSGTTDAGFRCHCGHKGGVQFTDYQAMTSPVAWVLPSVVCDRVIAAWRAHTKDLDGVHPNAEDQIRDFFSRHLEQPGGPTVTTPRYPLTAIPLDTPKPINNARPTRIILRSYAADDKPRIERLLGLARQLQLPVQLAGPWSCTAFPKGEEAHPALDVVFPEVLVHPRDVLILTFPNGEHIGDNGGSNLSEIENQLLWETREQDQRFITGLIELLGLPADASRGDIAAAVERSGTHYEALDVRVRNILGAVDGEETDEAARRFVETKDKETAATRKELTEWKEQVTSVLGGVSSAPLSTVLHNIKAAVAEAREKATWRNSTTALRQETAENQRKLLDILRAGTVEPSWERCISYTEARMKDTISERDALKEQLETAITAERQTIAQRIDLALTGNAAVTNLDTMLRAVEACREGYTREASNSVNLRRDCEMLQGLIGQIADALDAPPGDRLVVEDDGSLNTTLADRVVGYFERLYTAAGFTEPPQGGWAQLLAKFERPREN